MRIEATSVDDYIAKLPEPRAASVARLRRAILDNLPDGFEETMGYGMPAYVVPHAVYPGGYHCDPKLPLPFMNVASQKNHIALYHMGLYADETLLEWFETEFAKRAPKKLDMGKSCVRFRKPEDIPYELIGELAAKMSAADWVALYEKAVKR